MDQKDLFDREFYASQLPPEHRYHASLEHYQRLGWKLNYSPSPYFNTAWYRTAYCGTEEEPLSHFVSIGQREFYDPHPIFNSRWYCDQYLDSSTEDGPSAIEHYLTIGYHTGCDPHPVFDIAWYRSQHNLGDEVEPFAHYVLVGQYKNLSPSPLIDIDWYRGQVGDDVVLDPDPVSHYIHVGWRQGYDPHPLFNTAFFAQALNQSLDQMSYSPLEYLLGHPDAPSPHPLFDREYYSLQDAKSTIKTHPILHYVTEGSKSLIDPHPFFSKGYYYQQNSDVTDANRDAMIHYIRSGWKENRSFHPLFDQEFYLNYNYSNSSETILEHFLNHDLPCRPAGVVDTSRHPAPNTLKRVFIDAEAPVASPKGERRIGVFAHVYYVDLLPDVVSACKQMSQAFTLYVSTDSPLKARAIESVLQKEALAGYEIRVVPNRGRDIAPFLVGFRDRISEVDFGVHIHTKRSPHYSGHFDAWRHYLFESLFGSADNVNAILRILDRPEVGMYAPEHFPPIQRLIQWGGNFKLCQTLLSMIGERLHPGTNLDFPSGSMFWFKSAAMAKILALNLRTCHFDKEMGQIDGTLAHAIERSLFFFCEAAGYDWVVGARQKKNAVQIDGTTIGNRYFPSSPDLGVKGTHYPECTGFLVRPSSVGKPRLNLLIPTAETSEGYAGVRTALDLFLALREALGETHDARILSTDMSPSNQFVPPVGFDTAPISVDLPDCDIVSDAARRYMEPLFVRANDVFMATAWWTAEHALAISSAQCKLFNMQRQRKFVYLIQDFECGFYPWSTKFALAEATYRHPDKTIAVFNTNYLKDFFKRKGFYKDGLTLLPGMNLSLLAAMDNTLAKEKIVMLYARPHAERNCLTFIEWVVSIAVQKDPEFWASWRFVAIGENFLPNTFKAATRIEVLGRLSLDKYADIASRAALGMSLMISPHPSYPPLEMAQAGALVLTNQYEDRDLSDIHENIYTFPLFDAADVAERLENLARSWIRDPDMGRKAKAKVDWFFQGDTKYAPLARDIAMALAQDQTERP